MSSGRFLSARAYGRSRRARELPGGSHTAVRKAIASGRLVESLREVAGAVLIDPDVADQEWDQNTAAAKVREPSGGRPPAQGELFEAPPAPAEPTGPGARAGRTMRDAQALQAVYRAKLLRLELERRQGELVDAQTVEDEAFRRARGVRERLLQLPARVAPMVAPLSEVGEIRSIVESEVLEALEALTAE